MSDATCPIQICDHEDGCDQWAPDVWQAGGRYQNPADDPLREWDVNRTTGIALCPDHKEPR